jgi:hypothetical protein
VRRRSWLVAAVVLATGVLLQPGHDAVGESKNRAGLVVRYGDGRVEEMCVFFDEPTISGLELLERSGVTFVAERSSLGSAICKIDGQGCDYPSEDCFCEYPNFWGYWARDEGDAVWNFSDTGASDREIESGSMDGWSWGPNGAPAPPLARFEDVCPASASAKASKTSEPSRAQATAARSSAPSRTATTQDATPGVRATSDGGPSPSDLATDGASTGASPASTEGVLAGPRVTSSRPNYAGFAAFVVAFAIAAAVVVVLRRRRRA